MGLEGNALLLGLDIGGVNIKCSSVQWKDAGHLEQAISTKTFFPLWKQSITELHVELARVMAVHLAKYLSRNDHEIRLTVYPCASITGELSDAFASKKEGIERITSSLGSALDAVREAYPATFCTIMEPRFVAVDGTLRTMQQANARHREVAAANWHATAAWVGSFVPDCILMDCGSTTTDIIPIMAGKPSPKGKTDLDRLRSGELVYTGALRATIPSIARAVPVHGELVPVSFEKFALMADVHLLLGNITREQYDCDTADGRSTSIDDCKKRLARIVCEDAAELGDDVILEMARFLANAQVKMVQDALARVIARGHANRSIVVTGLGEAPIAMQAAEQAGCKDIISLAGKIGTAASIASSSVGILHVLATWLDEAGFDGW